MKRHGHLFELVAAFDNLMAAARRAVRGKTHRPAVGAFLLDLEPEVLALERELLEGTYEPRPYRSFWVYEPKPRRICAAHIRDRVVHHAICAVLDPILEAGAIGDSYACRRGKGTHRALARARHFARRHSHFLQLDVRHFFDAVDHAILDDLLRRQLKDRRLLDLLGRIVAHPIPGRPPGQGLPIGNLTSQYLANYYLGPVDHLVKDAWGVGGYVRYMDDLLLFGGNKAQLHRRAAELRAFLRQRLALELRPERTRVAPVSQGIPFLGFRVFPGLMRLQRAGWTRFKHKVRAREQACREREIDEHALVQSVQSLLGHVRHGDTCRLRRAFFGARLIQG